MAFVKMEVEPVFGWLRGCTEYWLGEVMGGMDLHYLKADFLWHFEQKYPTVGGQIIIRSHEEECELWVIAYLIEKGF